MFLCPRRQRNQNAAETPSVSDFPFTLWLMDRVSVDSVNQIVTSAPKEPSNHTASADLRPSVTGFASSCRRPSVKQTSVQRKNRKRRSKLIRHSKIKVESYENRPCSGRAGQTIRPFRALRAGYRRSRLFVALVNRGFLRGSPLDALLVTFLAREKSHAVGITDRRQDDSFLCRASGTVALTLYPTGEDGKKRGRILCDSPYLFWLIDFSVI